MVIGITMVKQDITAKQEKQIDNIVDPVKPDDLAIKGAYSKFDSPFMQLIAPLIATRYLWLAIEDINPKNFLKKPDPKLKPDFKPWKNPSALGYMSRNFAAFGMGATFFGIMSIYSRNTLHDIKALYSEAVGFELGKKKEDVTYGDIFLKSDNAALKVTRAAYTRRTLARLGTAATFFLPWQKFRDFNYDKPKYDANANAGVGAIGVYLLAEGFIREPSFFDAEQNMVNSAIRHADKRTTEIVQPKNIQALVVLQRKHLNKKYQVPEYASTAGQNELKVAGRIADLMNQTYHNIPAREEANFTIGKLNYLIGFGMLNSYPESAGFVELANRSKDMSQVNAAAGAIKNGQAAQDVFKHYGIDVEALGGPAAVEAQPQIKQFRETVGEKERATAPKTLKEFAAQTSDSTLSRG